MILKGHVAYGTRGRGGKVHVLHVEEVVGVTGEPKPGTYAATWAERAAARERGAGRYSPAHAPVYYAVYAACNSNGQHTAQVRSTMGPGDVTCESCRRALHLPR